MPIRSLLYARQLPKGLSHVVDRCTRQNPAERYASVKELRRDFLLLTAETEHVAEPTKAATELVSRFREQGISPEGLLDLDRLFREHKSDEPLLRDILPTLPDDVLHEYVSRMWVGFREVLVAYDEAVSGGLAWEYCDVVARFYLRIYPQVDNDTRRLLISRLLDMGVGHNRFYVMNATVDLLAGIQDPAEAAAGRQALLADPHSTTKLKNDLLAAVKLPLLRAAIEEATSPGQQGDN